MTMTVNIKVTTKVSAASMKDPTVNPPETSFLTNEYPSASARLMTINMAVNIANAYQFGPSTM